MLIFLVIDVANCKASHWIEEEKIRLMNIEEESEMKHSRHSNLFEFVL